MELLENREQHNKPANLFLSCRRFEIFDDFIDVAIDGLCRR